MWLRAHIISTCSDLCFKVRTCVPCQKFEKVKTEAPELKSIKLASPWYMIGEFNTFEFNVNILQFLVVNQNVIFSNFFCSGLCDPFISLCMQGVDLIGPFKASSRNQNQTVLPQLISSPSEWRPFLSRCDISMCLVSHRYELIIIMLFNDALDLCPDNKLKDPTLSFVKYNARTRRQWQHPRP